MPITFVGLARGTWYAARVRRLVAPPGAGDVARTGARASVCRVGADEFRVLAMGSGLAFTLDAAECESHLRLLHDSLVEGSQDMLAEVWGELDRFESPAWGRLAEMTVEAA